jgi:hypothetical protein
MSRMRFEAPKKLTRDEATRIFASGVARDIREALVSLALSGDDLQWAQTTCLDYTWNDDPTLRAVAATCLGHSARLHGSLDLDKVMPRLEALSRDAATAGYAETAIEDVRMFVRQR